MKAVGTRWIPHLIFLFLAFWTIHIFFTNGQIPVDGNDEPSHTFVEIPLFFQSLADGHYLHINLFNAFGTPMTGDAVAAPWAPHSLTYAFLESWRGMMANKVLTLFFAFEVLFFLGRLWGLAVPFATFAAAMSGTNPAFQWLHNHHPHQGALLYFGGVLLALELYMKRSTLPRLLVLSLAYTVLLWGVGIIASAMAHMFLAGYLVLSLDRVDRKRWISIALALAGPLALALPHYLAFATWAPLTERALHRLFDYENIGHLSPTTLANGMLYLLDQIHIHMDYAIVQTIVLALLTVYACAMTIGKKSLWNHRFMFRLFVFGIVSAAVVFTFLAYDEILAYIPFFKSADPTRFLWFSLVFLYGGAAYGLQRIWEDSLRSRWAFAAIGLVTLYFGLTTWGIVLEEPREALQHLPTDRLLAFASAIAILFFAAQAVRPLPKKWSWIILVVLFIPKFIVFDRVSEMARASEGDFGMIPKGLESALQPYSRMASLYAYGESPDQRIATSHVFGSNARSIVLSAELRDYFKSQNAIAEAFVSFHFLPFAADRLDAFGIRYAITRDDTLSSPLWKTIGKGVDRGRTYQVSERTERITPVYCESALGREYLDAEYVGNEIKIPMARDCAKVVATFFRWPGWSWTLNGERRALSDPSNVFLTASDAKRGDEIRFVFSPWFIRTWWLFALAAALFVAASVIHEKKRLA